MEAHEDLLVGIGVALKLLTLDALLIHVARYGVVDVEQGNSILCDAGTDELRQGTIDIHLTSNGDTTTSQTAVNIARNESEHGLESGPALVSHSHIFTRTLVSLNPVSQCQLILSEFWQYRRNLVASTQLLSHVLHYIIDARITCMLLESLQQVEF